MVLNNVLIGNKQHIKMVGCTLLLVAAGILSRTG